MGQNQVLEDLFKDFQPVFFLPISAISAQCKMFIFVVQMDSWFSAMTWTDTVQTTRSRYWTNTALRRCKVFPEILQIQIQIKIGVENTGLRRCKVFPELQQIQIQIQIQIGVGQIRV